VHIGLLDVGGSSLEVDTGFSSVDESLKKRDEWRGQLEQKEPSSRKKINSHLLR